MAVAAAGCSRVAVAPRIDGGPGVLVDPSTPSAGSAGGERADFPAGPAPDDPGPVIAWLALYERQDPAIVAREDPGLESYLRAAISRWPRAWPLHEHLAAWNVRAGDLPAARVEHEQARSLYLESPLWDDPWLGWRGKTAIVAMGNTFAGPVGWLLGKGVVAAVDAVAGEAPVAFPDEPSAVAWTPPPTAHPPRPR